MICENCNCKMLPDMSSYDICDADSMEIDYVCPQCGLCHTIGI
jgi:acetone carboxylase gamma subunit